jgi:predicted HAD superfamily Cof-like phosphohydrolase
MTNKQMHLSEEAKTALRNAGLEKEATSIDNHLFNTAHMAYTPMHKILEGTVSLPVGDYGILPIIPHPLDTIAQTKAFMETAGQEVKPNPAQPSPEVLRLRLSLELEELYEKAQAFGLEHTFQQLMFDKCDIDADAEVLCIDTHYRDTNVYNAVEVLDACADQRVVADGTILACGLQQAFPEAMAEVHRSNMSKFCTTWEQACDTQRQYYDQGIAASVTTPGTVDGLYVIKRVADGKILKNKDYFPANLEPILNKFTG